MHSGSLCIGVREVITKIKLDEAEIAHRQNTVEGIAPQVSVAT